MGGAIPLLLSTPSWRVHGQISLFLYVKVSRREARSQKSLIRRMFYFNHLADKSKHTWIVIVTTVLLLINDPSSIANI